MKRAPQPVSHCLAAAPIPYFPLSAECIRAGTRLIAVTTVFILWWLPDYFFLNTHQMFWNEITIELVRAFSLAVHRPPVPICISSFFSSLSTCPTLCGEPWLYNAISPRRCRAWLFLVSLLSSRWSVAPFISRRGFSWASGWPLGSCSFWAKAIHKPGEHCQLPGRWDINSAHFFSAIRRINSLAFSHQRSYYCGGKNTSLNTICICSLGIFSFHLCLLFFLAYFSFCNYFAICFEKNIWKWSMCTTFKNK